MRALAVLLVALLVLAPLVGGVGTPSPPVGAGTGTGAGTPADADRTVPTRADATATTPTATAATPTTDGPGAPVGSDTPTRGQVNESLTNRTPNVLEVPAADVARTEIDQRGIDLGPALGFAANETALRLATAATAERVESAPTTAVRQQRILGELSEIEQRAISLRTAEADAVRSYAAGRVTTRGFLKRLARIDMTARGLDARRERLATLAEETEDFSIDRARFATLERELDALTGPVRAEVVDVLAGRAPPRRFYVSAGEEAVTLTVIDGDRWVREAYRADLRDRGAGSMGPEGALNATRDAYPVIWATKDRGQAQVRGTGPSYLVRVPHARGRLSAFVDSGSQRVFKEFQVRPLSTTDDDETVSNVGDGLRLTVTRTYPGGPMKVNLTDAETGEPLDYNVTVGRPNGDREFVGRTGPDGVLWTLSLRGPFTVAAISPSSNSFVVRDVTPADPPRVYPPGNETVRTAG
jgi:hypothetical protein